MPCYLRGGFRVGAGRPLQQAVETGEVGYSNISGGRSPRDGRTSVFGGDGEPVTGCGKFQA